MFIKDIDRCSSFLWVTISFAHVSFAQGSFDFRNSISGAPPLVDAPLLDCNTTNRLTATDIVAELFWAPIGSTDFRVATALGGSLATPVSISTDGKRAGYWLSNGDRQVGVPPGAQVNLMVRAWDSGAGSFELAKKTGKKWGQSPVFIASAGDPGNPLPGIKYTPTNPPPVPNPTPLTGLQSFSVSDCSGSRFVITAPLVDQRVRIDSPLRFRIGASLSNGKSPQFHWQKMDAFGIWQELPWNNTAEFIVTKAQIVDSGSYRVVMLGGCCGPVESTIAQASVFDPNAPARSEP